MTKEQYAMRKAHKAFNGQSTELDYWDVWDMNTRIRHKRLTHKQAVQLQAELGDAIIIHDQH
ncbi:MAG: hypothetical protein ACO24H_06305 [Polynucleobacter sp.]